MYKPTPKPELQCEREPERTSPVLKMQNLIYNSYIFRAAIPFFHTSRAPLFTEINIIDFFKRFKDIATDYELSDNRKI